MKLLRPIVFFDLESTGTDVAKDRIVTFAAIKLDHFDVANRAVSLERDYASRRPIEGQTHRARR